MQILYPATLRFMPRIQAVLFDLFGTLIPSFLEEEHYELLSQLAERFQVDGDAFVNLWRSCYAKRATGEHAGLEDTLDAILPQLGTQRAGISLEDIRDLRSEYILRHFTPFEGVIETLQHIQATGRRFALVSDCSTEIPALWPLNPLSAWFDVTVFSCEIGHKKPEPEMYLTACQRLNVNPEQTVFLGDGGSRELRGAEALGITPILAAYQLDALRYEADLECRLQINDIRDLPDMLMQLER